MNRTPSFYLRGRWPTFAAIVGLVFIGLIRIPAVSKPFWNMDEAVSACIANAILDGGIPYRDAVDHRGPVTDYAYALVFWLFGRNNMAAVHACLASLVAGMGGLVYWIAARYSTARGAFFAVLSFGVLSFALFRAGDMLAAHTEWFQATFTLLAVISLLKSDGAKREWLLAMSGACYGLAYLSKQPALFDLTGAMAYFVLLGSIGGMPFRLLVRKMSYLAIGFLAVNAAVLSYFYSRSALQDFVFYFWTYNTTIYLPAVSLSRRLTAYHEIFKELLGSFALFAVLFVTGSLQQVCRCLRRPSNHELKYGLVLVCWALGSWAGALVSGRQFGHYFIQAISPVAILCGLEAERCLRLVEVALRAWKVRPRDPLSRLTALWAPLVGAAVVLALPIPLAICAERFTDLLPSIQRKAPISPEQQLVGMIRHLSSPQDSIFVWGFYTELYILADRRPSSRYTFCNVLTGIIPWENLDEPDTSYAVVPGAWKILMRELKKNRPVLIIDTSPGNFLSYGRYPIRDFPALERLIENHYLPAGEVQGEDGKVAFRILRRKDAPPIQPTGL